MTPKRRFLTLIFACLCFKKSLLIKTLKRDNQLSLFRRLEQISKKQINCDGSIEFLRLCQNFDLTPTFAQVDKGRKSKWKKSSAAFAKDVVDEELKLRTKESAALKCEINAIYGCRQNLGHGPWASPWATLWATLWATHFFNRKIKIIINKQ